MSPATTRTITVGLAIAALATLLIVLRRSPPPADSTRAPEPAAEVQAPPAAAAPASSSEVADLKRRLAEEMRARKQAESEAAALRSRPAPVETNAVAPLVRVVETGKRAGAFVPVMGELAALSGRDAATLTPEEKRRLLELQREHAKLLGALPEITGYQDNPEQYGRFFSSMFQQAAGLSDAQAAEVEAFMRERGTTMNQLRLNAANEPSDPKLEEAWEAQRDAFNEQTAHGLKAVLPPGAAERVGFGPELLEFLEMDFDKLNMKTPETKAP
jgi:hypothetical protein